MTHAKFRTSARAGLALAAFWAPATAMAHPGHGAPADFYHGLLHPFSGLDHLLVMLGVGMFAFLLGGRARWRLPLTFVSVMAMSAWLSARGAALSGIELAIALSVLAMGLLLARGKSLPIALALPLIALFAVFHGLAHGSEMPMSASGFAYGAGFVLATAGLHGTGLLLGVALGRLGQSSWTRWPQIAGVGMSALGVLLLVGTSAV